MAKFLFCQYTNKRLFQMITCLHNINILKSAYICGDVMDAYLLKACPWSGC